MERYSAYASHHLAVNCQIALGNNAIKLCQRNDSYKFTRSELCITSYHAFYLSLPVLLPIKSNPKLKALHFTLALKFHVILIKVGLS